MMEDRVKAKMVRIVRAIGQSITDEAENIVGGFEYGQGLEINCKIDDDFVPTITASREFITGKVVKALTCKEDTDAEL